MVKYGNTSVDEWIFILQRTLPQYPDPQFPDPIDENHMLVQ